MLKLLLISSLFYVGLVILIYFAQNKMLFFPSNEPFNSCSEIINLGATAQEMDFKGTKIRYYLMQNQDAKAWVIHFHGNSKNACERAFFMQELADIGVNFVLAEYPGYAGSTEAPNQLSLLENGQALLEQIVATDSKKLPIILYGESLGTGVATYLAAISNELNSEFKIRALILHTPYTSIGDIGQHHYPFLPVKLLVRNNFPAFEWASSITCPTLILHGDQDRTIPITNSKKLAQYFPTEPSYKEFANRFHNDLNFENPEYWETVKEFILKNL